MGPHGGLTFGLQSLAPSLKPQRSQPCWRYKCTSDLKRALQVRGVWMVQSKFIPVTVQIARAALFFSWKNGFS